MEFLDAEFAAPGALRGRRESRRQAIHVVPSIAVITEQELIVIVGSPADAAVLTFDTLPPISFHRDHHVGRELEARRMATAAAIAARHQFLRNSRLLVLPGVAQAEVTVRRWRHFPLIHQTTRRHGALLHLPRGAVKRNWRRLTDFRGRREACCRWAGAVRIFMRLQAGLLGAADR